MFQVYERDETGVERLLHEAETGAQASVFVSELKISDPARKPFIRRVKSEIDDDAWIAREQARFDDGTYKPLPWADEPWHKPLLFGHPSLDKPAMLSYTPDAEHGRDDRQLRVRPGRYLEKIGCPDVRHWCSIYSAAFEENKLKFAENADDIETVYRNGPSSCMSHSLSDYSGHVHPVRVYAAGDITLAYIGEPEDHAVTARALVWREKMVHSNIYGDSGRLQPLLENAGFSLGTFSGARLLKIENTLGEGWIMPYLDRISGVDDCGDYFEITHHGDYAADTTSGVINASCERCYECGDIVDEDCATCDDDGNYWCENCWSENHFYCEKCNESYHDNVTHTDVDGETWCEACLERYALCCYECSEYISKRHGEYVRCDNEVYCSDCTHRHLTECHECSEHFRTADTTNHSDGETYCRDCLLAVIEKDARHIRACIPAICPTINDPNQFCMDLRTYGRAYRINARIGA